MEKTIRVTGKGKLAVKPDTIRLILTFEGMQDEYDRAVKQSAEMTEEMKTLFEGLGFERSKLKTVYFNVSAEFESYQAKDKSWKRRFEGYKFVHRTKIEFPSDNEMLGKVLYAVGHASIHPEFNIEYTVADSEKSKNELLGNAVKDSMTKANVLANAAGIELGDILNIDYSWAEIDFISRPMNRMMLEECCMSSPMEADASYDIDIEPDDIEVSDNVTVVWKIR